MLMIHVKNIPLHSGQFTIIPKFELRVPGTFEGNIPTFGPPKPMKNEGFRPPNMGEITPKNEGYGFPWY